MRKEIGIRPLLPFAHLALGDICAAQNDIALAASHYDQAQALADEMDLRTAMLFSLLAMGTLYQGQGMLPRAKTCFEHAFVIAEEIGAKHGMARASAGLDELAKLAH